MKMRHIVRKEVSRLEADKSSKQSRPTAAASKKFIAKAKAFKATNGWFQKWKARYQVSLRERTNSKTKSAEERLPKVQKFHRVAKRMCHPLPEQHEKYVRFAPKNRFHVDQVPLEFSGHSKTYEKKGAKKVHIKKSKVDLERRVASL